MDALLGGLEGLGDFGRVLDRVADLAGVHLGHHFFRHTEADEAVALLELAATLRSGGFAGAGFVGFVVLSVLGHDVGVVGKLRVRVARRGGVFRGIGAVGQAEEPGGEAGNGGMRGRFGYL